MLTFVLDPSINFFNETVQKYRSFAAVTYAYFIASALPNHDTVIFDEFALAEMEKAK